MKPNTKHGIVFWAGLLWYGIFLAVCLAAIKSHYGLDSVAWYFTIISFSALFGLYVTHVPLHKALNKFFGGEH